MLNKRGSGDCLICVFLNNAYRKEIFKCKRKMWFKLFFSYLLHFTLNFLSHNGSRVESGFLEVVIFFKESNVANRLEYTFFKKYAINYLFV